MSYCILNPIIDNAKDCKICYDNWPVEFKRHSTRAVCKRKNWQGQVDSGYNNKNLVLNENYNEIAKK